MNILDRIEFHLATEEAINGRMALIEGDIKISPSVLKKTYFRFHSFVEKAKDLSKLSSMINLRTKRMTKIDKLLAWFSVLQDENYHNEALFAITRLRELGYEGRV